MPRLVPPAFPFELNFEICKYCENLSNFHDVDTYLCRIGDYACLIMHGES